MFSSSSRSALFTLALSALAVSAAPGLKLKVDGAKSVKNVENLKVVATLTNTGDVTLKLLNDPRTVLNTMPADTFKITDAAGKSPEFTGIKVKYAPEAIAANGPDAAFTVLAPGESTQLTHNLASVYNFTSSGEGSYHFEASNLFHYVDPTTKAPVAIHATAEAHELAVTGNLVAPRPDAQIGKRATFNGCSATQQTQLNTAASSAQSYASSALSYLNSHTSATPRQTTWFGTYTTTRHNLVTSHFTKISGGSFSSFKYDCTCTDAGTYAYVYPGTYGTIYLCGAFWNAPNTGTDSKAGTLIHECSHFTQNGGTQDNVYGQSGCKSLAISNPDSATMNADSHEYFAENTPAQS
jgi:peptidyl-Lys metalloendopeptidase